jgi:argininosuccinate lyase
MLGRSKNPPAQAVEKPARNDVNMPKPIPFAPVEKRYGEEYGRAMQYAADMQAKIQMLQDENAQLRSRLELVEGANDRLHDENERIIKASERREQELSARYETLATKNVNIRTKFEIVANILVEVMKEERPSFADTMREVEQAFAAALEPPAPKP